MQTEDQPLDMDLDLIREDNVKIYSKRAIRAFSILFSPIFGGILLMQNLRDIGNRKAANQVLFFSIAVTLLAAAVITQVETVSSYSFLINLPGAFVLSEYFFTRDFPEPDNYQKKKIWKPLLISIVITVVFLMVLFISLDFIRWF